MAVGVGVAVPGDRGGTDADEPGLADVGPGLGDALGDDEAVPLGEGDGLGLGVPLWLGLGEYSPLVLPLLQVDDGDGVPDRLAKEPLPPWVTPGAGDETAGLGEPLAGPGR